MYNEDWTLTKMGKQWQQLTKQWQTDETLTSNSNGVVKLRGFIGDYKVAVGGKSFDVTLPKTGGREELTIP